MRKKITKYKRVLCTLHCHFVVNIESCVTGILMLISLPNLYKEF